VTSLFARLLLGGMIGSAGLAPATSVTWEPWQHLVGVFDMAGPRSDGQLVVAAGGSLFLMSPSGTITPYANGPGGYHVGVGPETYIDVSPGSHVAGAGCDFNRDDVFALRLTAPLGITRIDPQGRATNFANITGVDGLNGIVFDTVGRFDHRLLVSGPHMGRTAILAIDCKGGIVTITSSGPALEGGLAIAPSSFGTHGGDLIAPDENGGVILSITASGQSSILVQSNIARGGDIGVESAGFVPPGFSASGFAYVADRGTAGNPHAGTDNILRLPSSDLVAAGVHDGDLLVSAEGGGVTIDVRCGAACTAKTIVAIGTTAHVEGHLLAIANVPKATASPLPALTDLGNTRGELLTRALAVLLLIGAALIGFWLGRRSRPLTPRS
jgi:hypothetical protein